MRICVIFNPAARGEKARRFRQSLDAISARGILRQTSAPGDARRLAAQAVTDGFEAIVAAGGDGTMNEVLNGLGDVENGFERACLGLLPLGTVNVLARDLGLPLNPEAAWQAIQRAREVRVDLPCVEFLHRGSSQRRYFAQLAGAGLDARAIELLHWPLKKIIGPLAYVVAGLRALWEPPAAIVASNGTQSLAGQLVLIGNGRLYGGPFRIFPQADAGDGWLDVCVFPRANWMTLLRCGPSLLLRHVLPERAVVRMKAQSLTLSGRAAFPFEVDGELGGHLPATISVRRAGLRVLTG